MTIQRHNNFGLISLEIIAVLMQCKSMPISKVLLIAPLYGSTELTDYFSNKRTVVTGLSKLFSQNLSFISNFNSRYYDTLGNSMNALQYLLEQQIVSIEDGQLILTRSINYESSMGKRAEKVYKSASKIVAVLGENDYQLYLNLRIKL